MLVPMVPVLMKIPEYWIDGMPIYPCLKTNEAVRVLLGGWLIAHPPHPTLSKDHAISLASISTSLPCSKIRQARKAHDQQ